MDSSDEVLLEITLISAQDLKPPLSNSKNLPLHRRLHSYATISTTALATGDPPKLRTRIDRDGASNPTWNDKFVFRLPSSALSPASSSSLSVDLFASGGWCLPDSLLGSVRLLLSNHRLLDSPKDLPHFAALGIRRPSGRFHGVLNVGLTLVSCVSKRAAEALAACAAVGYRDLVMGVALAPNSALKEVNRELTMGSPKLKWSSELDLGENEKENKKQQQQQLCGLGMGLQMRIHSSPSDENLQISWPVADDDRRTNEITLRGIQHIQTDGVSDSQSEETSNRGDDTSMDDH